MSQVFDLLILGSNSAKPAYDRHPTAQLLNVQHRLYLVDCGEGTQMRLAENGVKSSKIDAIFISHLHGDHFLGLLPLLDSFNLMGRQHPLHLIGPPDLIKIIDLHKEVCKARFLYPIHFIPIKDTENAGRVYEDEMISVDTIPMDHRVPCTGFLFREQPKERNILKAKIEEYQIPFQQIKAIKKGADFECESGEIIPNAELTLAPKPRRAYAYCSDTAYFEAIIPQIQAVDLLYHESTYLEDMTHLAAERGHATAKEAARIAFKAQAKKLLIGHFSSRYADLSGFEKEARDVFPNSFLALEGKTFNINNS